MHRPTHGEHQRTESDENPEGIAAILYMICLLPFSLCVFRSFSTGGWSEYQQAKIFVGKFQSTTCRIEEIIIEEITTTVNASYLIKVVNSTNETDQFRLKTLPLLRKPEQRSLINTSLTCFYDPIGVEQARLTLSDAFMAEAGYEKWRSMVCGGVLCFLLMTPYKIILLCRLIRECDASRSHRTDPIVTQPFNFI